MSRLAVLSLCLITVGCASASAASDPWPSGLPPRGFYEAVWEGDPKNREVEPLEEYVTWVVRFYRGSLLAPGWGASQEKLVAGLEADDQLLLAAKLACLGQMVSAEWAKHNERRRITTEMLRTWSRVLVQAKGQGHALASVDRLIVDVSALLKGELEPAAISADRYRETIASVAP